MTGSTRITRLAILAIVLAAFTACRQPTKAEDDASGSGSGPSSKPVTRASKAPTPTPAPATPTPAPVAGVLTTSTAENPEIDAVRVRSADGGLVELLFEPDPPTGEWTVTAKGGAVNVAKARATYFVVPEDGSEPRAVKVKEHARADLRWPNPFGNNRAESVRFTVDRDTMTDIAEAEKQARFFKIVVAPLDADGKPIPGEDGKPFELTLEVESLPIK